MSEPRSRLPAIMLLASAVIVLAFIRDNLDRIHWRDADPSSRRPLSEAKPTPPDHCPHCNIWLNSPGGYQHRTYCPLYEPKQAR